MRPVSQLLVIVASFALAALGSAQTAVLEANVSTDEESANQLSSDGAKSNAAAQADDATSGKLFVDNVEGKKPNSDKKASNQEEAAENTPVEEERRPIQTGPFIELLGESLISLEMMDESHAQLYTHYTNEILKGKKVVGLYFSADWCGPCRKFTPELVTFYNKMNHRRGRENQFEIIWISRCRDVGAFGQYFTKMNWLAMPPEDAMGKRGQMLSEKYKVKGIPSLVLLDDVGNVITTDARNKIPLDRAGVGFPWRNPLETVLITVLPKSLRLMIKSQLQLLKHKVFKILKGAIAIKTAA